MKKCKNLLLLGTIAFAASANAATLSVTADQASYNIGDTATLTVTGDAEGASSATIYGRLLFDNPGVVNVAGGTPSQTPMISFGTIPWLVGPLTCTSSSCEMFSQISPITTPSSPTAPLSSTVSFVVTGLGSTNATWDTSPSFAFDFFGLTNAGTTITVVPEPTTAALLGLGLLGLAFARRR